jgi:WD40 repeat protein
MKTYTAGTFNENETIWAVARLGPERNQIAALFSGFLGVWNEGTADLIQALSVPSLVRNHSGLSACPGGEWLAGWWEGHLLVWRWSGKKWEAHSEDRLPGLCAATFAAGTTTLLAAQVVKGEHHPVEALVTRRPLGGRHSLPWQVVSRFSARPANFDFAEDLYRSHWWAADLSSDGGWLLLSARDKAIHLWEVAAGKHAGSVKLRGLPNEAPFAPDGSLFAVDCGTTVYLHATQTQERVAAWKVPFSYVPRLAWSPDGRWLARVDRSSTVRVFDVAGRREASALAVRGQRGSSVAFSPDGSTYLVGTVKSSVVVWDLDV